MFSGYYHGVSPWCQKIDYPGVLPEDVANNIMLPWNDIPLLERTIEENKNEIACLIAQPYDLMVAGKDGKSVSTLRLWKSTAPGMDMTLFNQGEYMRAMERKAMAEVITQVLYPADNHREGKSLRLSQQYFLVSASVQDIVQRHLEKYGTMDNLPEMAAVHINDTHPTLAIPELMRILLDECGYGWEASWDIIHRTFAYTNHTVMAEALECWPEDLFRQRLPRIYQIVQEINRRFSEEMMAATGGDSNKVSRMAIISYGLIKMANLCVATCHSVNGVSQLHSEIVKETVFPEAYSIHPEKFTNVTNGIAHRRWLNQSNPELCALLNDCIGEGYAKDASKLAAFKKFENDETVLKRLEEIKALKKQLMDSADASNINQRQTELRRNLNEVEERIRANQPKQNRPAPTRGILVGDTVELLKLGTKASVIGINKDGTYQLQAGILKMNANADEIYLIENPAQNKTKSRPAHSGREMKMTAMSSEIDLRGMDCVDAVIVLERYMD